MKLVIWIDFASVADPACLSRILDSTSGTKEEGEEKNLLSYFFCSHKFYRIENYFIFEKEQKKNLKQLTMHYCTFYSKIASKHSKIWVGDRGSEIRDLEKTYSESLIQGSKKHRITDPDPQHWI